MKAILSQRGLHALEELAQTDLLLGFDFDGTLAPITGARERARMRAPTRRLLRRVAELYPCVVISGRGRSDVARRLEGIELRAILGNHGIDPRWATPRSRGLVRRWLTVLEPALAGVRGVEIEDKLYSLAIHYRRARDKPEARAAIARARAPLRAVRALDGKHVVDLLPQGAPGKGLALEVERARLRCETLLYVGDDVTDEDVFAFHLPGRMLAIRVGSRRGSRAGYCLRRQSEIDDLLRALVQLRRRPRRQTAVRA